MSEIAGDTTLMRAVVSDGSGSPGGLRLEYIPRPTPIGTEVLVRVHAAGVNPVDWKTHAGAAAAVFGSGPVPVVGWDVSGVVEALGGGVTTLGVGDEVFGMPWFPRPAGAYSDYVTAPSRQLARKPASLSHEQAAGVPLAALTAWQVLIDTAEVKPGQRVLVHAAAGGVGHLAVQLAKHRGAYVIATARAARHEWLRGLGADETVDYTTTPTEQTAADVDVVVDLVGAEVSLRSLPVVREGGLVVAVSSFSPGLAQAAKARGVRATGVLVEPDGASLRQIAQLFDAGELQVEISDVFDLTAVAEAHELGRHGHTRGKIVLRTGA